MRADTTMAYTHPTLNDVTELARALIATPSPSGEEGALGELLARTMRTFCETESGPLGSVIGRLARGEGPAILIEGHMDTVAPGDPSRWSSDPYDPVVRDGHLFGRGATDMKGAIAAQLVGAAQVAARLKGTLYFVYVPLEEPAEGAAFARALEGLPATDLVILGEPTDLRLGIGHRGRMVVRLEAWGRQAHASMPELGENAIEAMVATLPAALALPLPEDPLLGKGTATLVGIGGPPPAPTVPDVCWALLDRRIVRGECPDEILAAYVQSGLRAELERVELRAFTGESVDLAQHFPAWAVDVRDLWPGRAWEALHRPPLRVWRFSTDGVESCGRRGIPTVGYGPGEEGWAHRVDERVAVADLERGARGYARLLSSLMIGPAAGRRA